MLMISRKSGERFIIGDDTIVQIQRIDRYKVRLCISSPKDKSIMREELLSHADVAAVEARAKEGHTPCQPL